MHGRAAVAAGLLRQSVLERAGDVGLVEDVERAEGIGDEHRAVDQVVGQPESGDAYDAVLLVSHDQNTRRSEEHTSELQYLMRISYAVFCLKKTTKNKGKIMPLYQHHEYN